MKSFIITFLFLSSLSLNGQDWFQPDDLWTYRYFSPFSTSGYMEMRPLRDTLIVGQEAMVMEEDYVAIRQQFGDSVLFKRNVIMYEMDKQVYILDDRDSFRLTYDFNLEVGDSLVYEISFEDMNCEQPVTYYLDSLANFIIGTDTLIHQFFTFRDDNWEYEGNAEIIETIGSITSGFDINFRHLCYFDIPGTWLCSFGDSNGEAVFLDRDCYELPVDTDDLARTDFQLYPNPVSDRLVIDKVDYARASIYNLQGRRLASYSPEDIMDVSFLAKGIYQCVIESASGEKGHKTFIKL